MVRPLVEAGTLTVAVLGKHDYSLMKESSEVVTTYAGRLRDQLTALGVIVLENEAALVVAGGDTLWVAGVGSGRVGRAEVDATLAVVPEGAPRLWLMHNSERSATLSTGASGSRPCPSGPTAGRG